VKVKDKLGGAIQKRKVVNILAQAAARLRNDLSPKFNQQAVDEVYKNWRLLTGNDIPYDRLETGISNITSMPLVSFSNQSWTVGECFKKLIQTTGHQRKRVKTVEDVKEFITGIAEREVTMQRALASRVEQDSAVLAQINLQSTEFRLNRWKSSIEDTVGRYGWDEATLRKLYDEKKSEYMIPPEVNVGEILVRTREEATSLMKQLQRGANFEALARTHSIRLWAAKQGGELGFGPKSMYGTWGDTLFASSIGALLGPFSVDPYYGIFRIVARHAGRMKSFVESRAQIIDEMSVMRKRDAVKEAVEHLRKNATVAIDEELLSNIAIN